jgi:excisionase family DNA binding protein
MPILPELQTTSISEFCRETGLGSTKVYELINSGELETLTIGKKRLIQLESWRRYLAKHLGKSAPANTRSNWRPPRSGTRQPSLQTKIAPRARLPGAISDVEYARSQRTILL